LHRVVALRGFGLTLAEIGQVLDGELGDPRELVRRQLDQVDELEAATKSRQTATQALSTDELQKMNAHRATLIPTD